VDNQASMMTAEFSLHSGSELFLSNGFLVAWVTTDNVIICILLAISQSAFC